MIRTPSWETADPCSSLFAEGRGAVTPQERTLVTGPELMKETHALSPATQLEGGRSLLKPPLTIRHREEKDSGSPLPWVRTATIELNIIQQAVSSPPALCGVRQLLCTPPNLSAAGHCLLAPGLRISAIKLSWNHRDSALSSQRPWGNPLPCDSPPWRSCFLSGIKPCAPPPPGTTSQPSAGLSPPARGSNATPLSRLE